MDPTGMPSLTGGAGGSAGPSMASGDFMTSLGGMDGSGWAVNFGQAGSATATVSGRTPGVATPLSVGYMADQFGLPNSIAGQQFGTSGNAGASGASATGGISPLMILAAVVAIILIRRHK